MSIDDAAAARRTFLLNAGITGVGSLLGAYPAFSQSPVIDEVHNAAPLAAADKSVIGPYGAWAKSLTAGKLPSLSFRNKEITDVDQWKLSARQRVKERMAIPYIGLTPKAIVNKQYNYDGLEIEEITWQLPYGRPTEATVLKPQNAKGPLPGVLAFHDHGGNKFYGSQKIVRTADILPVGIETHQKTYYENKGWANELAKRGYVVLVADAFPFASRRVMISDVPEARRDNLKDPDPNDAEQIAAYNKWASSHEQIMARSLTSAGTTFPGVWLAEDLIALDVLAARTDVDKNKLGCGGLSGGGMRSVYLAGLDERIKCVFTAGFMTTWNDFVVNKSYTHTWMIYIPLLPNELDLPEILALRIPLPSLVLSNSEDPLYTLSEMQRADDMLKEIYAKAGSPDKYRCSFHQGVHKFDIRMQSEAFAWFDQWLKNKNS